VKPPRPLLFLVPALLAIVAALAPGSQARDHTPAEPSFALAPPPAAAVARSYHLASPSLCEQSDTSTAYPWPIAPFHEQHPIRGYFGDPRTVFRSSTNPELGAFSFHNGVDIVAPVGTPVYPVRDGVVKEVKVNEVVVLSDGGQRIFQYWHISPLVRVNDTVEAERTVLGLVTAPFDHVHLTEIDRSVVQNPLQPDHLTPYRNATVPIVDGLYLRDQSGTELSPDTVTGSIDLIARALDAPGMPVPEPWTGLPVSPALVGFELTTPDGRQVLPEQTPVDFEHTEPPNPMFWNVYAPGTFQNFPAVGKHLLRGLGGEYYYNLTPDLLDTAALRPGKYVVTVTAKDTCGNTGTLSESIRVLPQRREADRAASGSRDEPQPPRVDAWPSGARRAWTVVITSLGIRQGLDAAREAARMASGAGVSDVGVLDSSQFAPFRPGSYVVFAGVYGSSADVAVALTRVMGLYPHAYARELVAKQTPARPSARIARRSFWRPSVIPSSEGRFTVVLLSVPVRLGPAGPAREAEHAVAVGFPAVRVLITSRYSSLRPGYRVVASGHYPSPADAARAASLAAGRYPGAYARELVPKRGQRS
jgi:Peptidase family M23